MTPQSAGQRGWGEEGLDFTTHKNNEQLFPVAAWVSGRSLAGIVSSNPAGGMVVCLLCVLCLTR
jgi:hypothetical protein